MNSISMIEQCMVSQASHPELSGQAHWDAWLAGYSENSESGWEVTNLLLSVDGSDSGRPILTMKGDIWGASPARRVLPGA